MEHTEVIDSATARINELDEENAQLRKHIVLLTVACRSLLHHCDPDKPLPDGLVKARVHARDVLRVIAQCCW